MANIKWTVRGDGIKRQYGAMTDWEVLPEKVKLRATLLIALLVLTKTEERNEEEDKLNFIAEMLAASVNEDGVDWI